MNATTATQTPVDDAERAPLFYAGLCLLARALGPGAQAREAVRTPGAAGYIQFAAARGDTAAEVAATLHLTVAEVDALAADLMRGGGHG